MAEIPQTRYARSGDLHIAYQVLGNGPIDVMLVPGWISHLELEWDNPRIVRAFERLSSFCRLIRFDKRGTGLSDRVSGVASLEERMDDVRAVMDAVGSKRAALLGISEGGPMSILFAATYPERTSALVLYGSFARDAWAPDNPWGTTQERQAELDMNRAATWGEGLGARVVAPDLADDDEFRRWFGRLERGAATPATIKALGQMNLEIDVRSVLSAIAVPTLVVHRTGDLVVNVENGRLIARTIPGANLVELPGRNHAPWAVDAGPLLEEIEAFLTGVRSSPELDRVLATLLFTDIVGSTERAAAIGDSAWKELLEHHRFAVRQQLERHRGREINTTGDGFLASFDGPARAVRCGRAIVDTARALGIQVRAGVHTGECEVMGDDLGGIAVHIGARVAGQAMPDEVLVSSTVKDLVAGAGLRFESRGLRVLKGVPGEWSLFSAV
jgi:pimeloyl-ACP methyl ester carboxylesterase